MCLFFCDALIDSKKLQTGIQLCLYMQIHVCYCIQLVHYDADLLIMDNEGKIDWNEI